MNNAVSPPFYLLAEPSFHARYLIDRWVDRFRTATGFRGVAFRSSGPLLADCANETEHAMLRLFGAPSAAAIDSPTFYLGADLNSETAREWLSNVCANEEPFILVFLDQILAPWWIRTTGNRIINAHSAVLPFARGMHAIEQLAASGDRCALAQAAGATVHFVDSGVDSGPIIHAQRMAYPFHCASIWELKARSLMLAFDLLVDVAVRLSAQPCTVPVGLSVHPAALGPNFRSAAFTPSARRKAEIAFAEMKKGSM